MFSAQRGKGDLPVEGKVHPAPAALLLTGGDGGTWGWDILIRYMSMQTDTRIYLYHPLDLPAQGNAPTTASVLVTGVNYSN